MEQTKEQLLLPGLPKNLAIVNDRDIDQELALGLVNKFKEDLTEFASHYSEIKKIIDAGETPENAKVAKELLPKIVKLRTSIAKTHKEEKGAYRNVGLFIDDIKNKHGEVTKKVEDILKKIKDYEEIAKAKEEDKLRQARKELIAKYVSNVQSLPDLGKMDQGTWDAFFSGTKVAWEKEEAKRKEDLQAHNKAMALLEETKTKERKIKMSGDPAKMNLFIEDLNILMEKYTFDSAPFISAYATVGNHIKKINSHLSKLVNKHDDE